jgi:hypothetical protein
VRVRVRSGCGRCVRGSGFALHAVHRGAGPAHQASASAAPTARLGQGRLRGTDRHAGSPADRGPGEDQELRPEALAGPAHHGRGPRTQPAREPGPAATARNQSHTRTDSGPAGGHRKSPSSTPAPRRFAEKNKLVIAGSPEELHVPLEQLTANRNGPQPALPAAGFEAAAQLINRGSQAVQFNRNAERTRSRTPLVRGSPRSAGRAVAG